MRIVYNAPNRAHHYGYARELNEAGILKAFVCGFSRCSPRSPIPEIGATLVRVDQIQTLAVASQKFKMPVRFSEELFYLAKLQIDRCSRAPLKNADVFVFYNGCGLDSARWFREQGGIGIVEAVNCHVLAQEQILAEEHRQLKLPWRPFHVADVKRRVAEVEEADYVVVPSTFAARSFVAKGFSRERLLRVPYPIERIPGAARLEHKPRNKDGIFRVLYVGSISVRKGVRYLIEAFRDLKHPRKELWIVGPTANPSGIEGLSIPDGVKFLGALKGDELRNAYESATVFCLPSLEDGYGLVLNEAIHHGLPVIATENTAIEDLFTNGDGGMIVPIRDSKPIADWLNRLASDGQLLTEKRRETAAAAARLSSAAQPRPTLSSTLLKCCRSPQTGYAHDNN